jgi:E3 ubiquitin-protein ligase RNF213
VHLRFAQNLEIEEGIAMNQALMENLFVTIVCILNKVPCFVVGKPGSSKTLTMQASAPIKGCFLTI